MERESMEFDVVIVGGVRPAVFGNQAKQLADEAGKELSVCLIEKGSEVGAHILSGLCLNHAP